MGMFEMVLMINNFGYKRYFWITQDTLTILLSMLLKEYNVVIGTWRTTQENRTTTRTTWLWS